MGVPAVTTIAYRNGVLAADTGISSHDSRIGHTTKIARNNNGDLAGAAGGAVYCYQFLTWFSNGENGEAPSPKKEDGSYDRGVVFRASGKLEVHEPGGFFEIAEVNYFAFGSGRPEALGAMHHGATAKEAVAAAMAHDSGTYGSIEVLDRLVIGADVAARLAASRR